MREMAPLERQVSWRILYSEKMNKLHEQALRIAYDDYCSSFEELLDKGGAVTLHQRNLRAFAIEMYKVSNGLSPTFMVEMIMMEISQILQKKIELPM